MTESTEDGTVVVRRSRYGRVIDEAETKIAVPDFGDRPTARIAVGMTSTRRMSEDMEFMKIEVRVELPCHPNDEDIRETRDYAIDLIHSTLAGEEPAHAPRALPTSSHTPGKPIA